METSKIGRHGREKEKKVCRRCVYDILYCKGHTTERYVSEAKLCVYMLDEEEITISDAILFFLGYFSDGAYVRIVRCKISAVRQEYPSQRTILIKFCMGR